MTNKDKSRSYGYANPDNKHRGSKHGQIIKEKWGKAKQQNWYSWVILPIKIILFVLKYFVLVLAFFWEKKPKLKERTKKQLKRQILLSGLVALVFTFLFGSIVVAWVSRDLPDPDRLTDRQVAQSTKIYDRTGQHILYEVYAQEKRTLVELEEVPKDLINGVIATEDTKFYEHKGVRPLSIVRAMVVGIFTSKRIGGTSTITQQLVRNAILTNERKISRKIKEIVLSLRLEQKYTKEQILKIYFNEIPYGSVNYGVEAASQAYFGKHVSDLTLSESAILAGLPKGPSIYLHDLVALKNRRDFVLERMFEEGYLSREEADNAQAESINIKNNLTNIQAPHFVLYVKKQLIDLYGEQAVDTGGLKVITSLDWDKQQAAETAIKNNEEKLLEAQANNTALVSLNPKTGEILAMVGSRDFFNDEINGQFNVATLGKRQPGSSFKPIIYTAAFELGYTPETILFDVITDFAVSGKPYRPLNYDLTERGPVTMRQALQGSLNIPAVKTMYLVGTGQAVKFAERLGYTTLKAESAGLSLVLGGGEVNLLEHTSAYATLANNGTKHKPVSILRVEDAEGEKIYEWKTEKGEPVLKPEITSLVSNVLSDDAARAYVFGTNSSLTLPGRPVAAKTGTTNNYVDAWTMGYTPSLVTGVWAGNTNNTPMKQGYGGSRVAGEIWNEYMRLALANSPIENFPLPPPNTAEKPVLRGSTGGSVTLLVDKVTGKIATSSTPEKYIETRTYVPAHCILHYVKKDDPLGPIPEHPEDDPQYLIWEAAIQDWANRQKAKDPNWSIIFSDPPSDFDDSHSLELIPTLEIVFPKENEIFTTRQIDTDIRVSAPRGINKVSYEIDNLPAGIIKEHPFNLNKYIKWLENGTHILRVIAEDDVGNLIEKEVLFKLQAETELPGVSWSKDEQTTSSFPTTLFLNPFRLSEIKEIKIYLYQNNEKNLYISITDFANLIDFKIPVKINSLPPGDWKLEAEAISITDQISAASQTKLRVE
ncbi:MAG TPA: PBP1A family penicillin-binding protein [Patescibacteria group bacterium]|nr:PBP1A family penicillin-binding protein [Patescibacteria group bacterium]